MWFLLVFISFFIKSNFGQSPQNDDDERPLICDKTLRGSPAGPGVNCVFPFEYDDITFNHCTTYGYDIPKDLQGNDSIGVLSTWCATKVDRFGRADFLLSNNWGFCDPRCPFDDGNGKISATDFPPACEECKSYKPEYEDFKLVTLPPKIITTTVKPVVLAKISTLGKSGDYLPLMKDQECGYSVASGYIVGGELALRGEFPFAVLLGYDTDETNLKEDVAEDVPSPQTSTFSPRKALPLKTNPRRSGSFNNVYRCSGSLINRKYVLTAAHCDSEGNKVVEVVVGDHDVLKDPDCPNGDLKKDSCVKAQRFKPEEFIPHEEYDPGKDDSQNDIALIRLDGLVNTIFEGYNIQVMPVCLPLPENLAENEKYDAKNFVVHGWGATRNYKDISEDEIAQRIGEFRLGEGDDFRLADGRAGVAASRLPRKVNLDLVDLYQCKQEYPSYEISDRQLCVGGEAELDSCSGDSGGPLVNKVDVNKQMVLYGLVSYGDEECGKEGKPAVYTRVDQYIQWIKEKIKP